MKTWVTLRIFLVAMLFVLSFCGSPNYMIWELHLDNGETLEVKLDIKDGEAISIEDNRLVVRKHSEELLIGEFYTNGEFDELVMRVKDEESIEILNAEPVDKPSYYFFQYEVSSGTGYGFIEKIEGSKLSSIYMYTQSVSLENAEDTYHQLHFSLKD